MWGTIQTEEDELTLAAASVSTSKAWESWWKSSAKHRDQKRERRKVKLDFFSLRKASQRSHRLLERKTSADAQPTKKGEYISNWSDALNMWSAATGPVPKVRLRALTSMALTPRPGGLGSFSPCLGVAHLLSDYPDFCLGGRRGPSVYMLSSPGRVKIGLFILSPQDRQENTANRIREIQGGLCIATGRLPHWISHLATRVEIFSGSKSYGGSWRLPSSRVGPASCQVSSLTTEDIRGSWQGQIPPSYLETGTQTVLV